MTPAARDATVTLREGLEAGAQVVNHRRAMTPLTIRIDDLSGEPIRRDLLMVLQHIVLSHHGEPEFGAAVLPKTPEAILVNLIDNLDAKTQMAIDAVAAPAEDENWTEYHKAFNSKLYRPSITIRD